MRLRECIHGARALFTLLAVSSSVALLFQQKDNRATGLSSGNRRPQCSPILRIIGTNDFHGALEARPSPSGVTWGGADLARGKPISEIFNALRFDVAAMGNHDLDWGADSRGHEGPAILDLDATVAYLRTVPPRSGSLSNETAPGEA